MVKINDSCQHPKNGVVNTYDIVAVEPTTEQLFEDSCRRLEVSRIP